MDKKDILIIGSGIAGMSAAGYAARSGRDTLVVERLAPGGQCMYIDKVENYPGLAEPVMGYGFSEKFEEQATRFGAAFTFATVKEIKKEGDHFIVKSDAESWEAGAVIFATGAEHRQLGAKGEDIYQGKGVSYCGTCDGPLFKGKKILVVGGGDTALSDTLYLSKLTDQLTICHRKDRFRAQSGLVAQVKAIKGIQCKMETTVKEILGDGKKVTGAVLVTKDGEEQIACDAVFIFVGMLPQTSLLDKSLLDDHGYVKTDRNMMTSLPGLFAVGDVRDTPFRQLVTAASDGAIAAHAASEYLDALEGRAYS